MNLQNLVGRLLKWLDGEEADSPSDTSPTQPGDSCCQYPPDCSTTGFQQCPACGGMLTGMESHCPGCGIFLGGGMSDVTNYRNISVKVFLKK